MFIALRDAVASDLALFGRLRSPAEAEDLLAAALAFLTSGSRRGAFKKAAAALGAAEDEVAGAVMGVSEVLLEGARVGLSHPDFFGSLADVSMPEETRRVIAAFYEANRAVLRERVAGAGAGGAGGAGGGAAGSASASAGAGALPTLPEYRGLDWRLEVLVAGRHLHDRMQPAYALRLDTAAPAVGSGAGAGAGAGAGGTSAGAASAGTGCASAAAAGGPRSLAFSSDFAALRQASEAIDEAVAEAKSAHMRRVLRYIR
jgi:hypothetical protein